eukprot:365748-Chlamydomonas_euryale.AAC.9
MPVLMCRGLCAGASLPSPFPPPQLVAVPNAPQCSPVLTCGGWCTAGCAAEKKASCQARCGNGCLCTGWGWTKRPYAA